MNGEPERPTAAPAGRRVDVLIAGAGFAGLALAIVLRQALGPEFAIEVADPGLGRPSSDQRATAIAAAARRLLETIGVWGAVAARAQPILGMTVTDSRLADAVRPAFLTFAGEVEPGEPFAHMVENADLIAALTDKARELHIELRAGAVTGFEPGLAGITAALAGASCRTQLLVAADGARSRLRELAGIATHGWSYGQTAIVT